MHSVTEKQKVTKNIRLFVVSLLVPALVCALLLAGCEKEENTSWKPGEPLDKGRMKVGILYVDKAESGFSYAHDIGIRAAQREVGLRDDQIVRKFDVNDADPIMIEHMMNEAISEGAGIIIATSWGHMDTCEKLAAKYPNVIFAHATGHKSNETNFTNYFGRIYQARYLSGIVAGLKTKTGKLGFVAAQDMSNSEVTGGLNAFALGVESVNPGAAIYVSVTHSWYDPEGERNATRKLIDAGCDVIAQHCNTAMPQIEAEKRGVWGIGYNSDMSREAPDAELTSVIWNWGAYYTSLFRRVIDGSFTPEPYFGSLSDGMVDIAPLNPALTTPEMEAAVTAAKERMRSGSFNVFDGEMKTSMGRVVGKPGGTLSDSEITGGIDWYYHNIIKLTATGWRH